MTRVSYPDYRRLEQHFFDDPNHGPGYSSYNNPGYRRAFDDPGNCRLEQYDNPGYR